LNYSSSITSLIAAAVLWSTGGLLIKYVSWNPLAITGMRSAISAVLIIVFLKKPRFHFSFHQVGGALCFTGTVIFFVSATKLTTAANAILLQYTAPIYTALFSRRFLNEKTHWFDWIAVAAVFCGIFLFFLDDLTLGGYYGNLLALAAGAAAAWLGLFLRKQKDSSPIESVLLGNIIAAFIGFPFMFSSKLAFNDWIGLLLLGVFQLGLSYILYAHAIKQVKALDAMLIFTIEPILNPVWVFLFMGEVPGQWALVGGTVVLVSLVSRAIYVNMSKN